jgi:hypothetical protein
LGAPAARGVAAATTGVAWTLTAVLMVEVARVLAPRRGRDRIHGVGSSHLPPSSPTPLGSPG